MITALDPLPYKFKDTLFESVSFQPWSLEYKMIYTEVRMDLNEAINELWTWYASTHRVSLTESAVSPDEVIEKFRALGKISSVHIDKLRELSDAPNKPPSGLLNKFLNPLNKGLERLSKLTVFPQGLEDSIQTIIGRIYTKSENSPFREQIKKIMRSFLNLIKKGGWVPSVVLLALGIIQSVIALPFIGSTVVVLAIFAGIVRVVADLVNGTTLTYALGKAAALFGAGYGAAELFKSIMPLLSAAEAATPPATIGGEIPADIPADLPTMTPMPQGDPEIDLQPSGVGPDAVAAPVGGQGSYSIQRGDTLGKIAQQYGVSVAEIMAINPEITNPHRIMPNVELQIPPRSDPSGIWQGFDFGRFPFPGRR